MSADTKTKGSISELKFAAKFIEMGYNILFPYGENQRYDLVIEKNNVFKRIQIKTASVEKVFIRFSIRSRDRKTNSTISKNYNGEVDYFAVFSPELEKYYLIPIEIVENAKSKWNLTLRLEPLKRKTKNITKYSKDFEI